MATKQQLEYWLADAEMQYHVLATGRQAKVFVDQNGERVEYNTASLAKLSAYIQDLKRQLGLVTTSGPMNVWM